MANLDSDPGTAFTEDGGTQHVPGGTTRGYQICLGGNARLPRKDLQSKTGYQEDGR